MSLVLHRQLPANAFLRYNSRMECREKQRLTKEYFDALIEQKAIMEKAETIKAGGDAKLISIGETQAQVAIEECYEAWQALNAHRCTAECESAEYTGV